MSASNFSAVNTEGITLRRAYTMVGFPQDEPFKDKRLQRKSPDAPFEIVTTKIGLDPTVSQKAPDGWYDFVITVEAPRIVYIRRERFAADAKSKAKYQDAKEIYKSKLSQHAGRGHSSIAKHGAVLFAGSILFENGVLKRWENKSGHYLVGKDLYNSKDTSRSTKHAADQTQLAMTLDNTAPLLPISAFTPIDPNDF